jgi:hypothetical protein
MCKEIDLSSENMTKNRKKEGGKEEGEKETDMFCLERDQDTGRRQTPPQEVHNLSEISVPQQNKGGL